MNQLLLRIPLILERVNQPTAGSARAPPVKVPSWRLTPFGIHDAIMSAGAWLVYRRRRTPLPGRVVQSVIHLVRTSTPPEARQCSRNGPGGMGWIAKQPISSLAIWMSALSCASTPIVAA